VAYRNKLMLVWFSDLFNPNPNNPNFPFLQTLPTAAFLFFSKTDYIIPQTFTITSEHIPFLFFSFYVLHFLVVVSVR